MNKEDKLLFESRNLFTKLAYLNKLKMEKELKGYKASEVHAIEFIGKNNDANVSKLAKSFRMTNGAMSKVTKKLIQKNTLETYQREVNKKEIYFKLTKKGQEVFALHERLHEEFKNRDKKVFDRITENEFKIMLNFIKNYSEHLDKELNKK